MRGDIYRNVLLLVAELHKRGYQRLRIAPGSSPSGVYWRCSISAVGNYSSRDDARVAPRDKDRALYASYTSGQEDAYFGWEDAAGATVSQLADRFIESFPQLCEMGRGADPAYVAWYQDMLRASEPNGLPIASADYDLPEDCIPIAYYEPPVAGGRIPDICIPLPPPYEAGDL